ncbi:hypothetical protein ABZT04_43045 [Streptomyces sp. NPDC005492]|uniref:hypothetical protein n=1 Tax=Streptomyces sp. NPDC005492 TaxID=3156883 RepID=UPI0033AA4F48
MESSSSPSTARSASAVRWRAANVGPGVQSSDREPARRAWSGRRRPCSATSSRLKGHDQIVIAKQGGWAPHSKVLAGYLEVADEWEDNALLGVL